MGFDLSAEGIAALEARTEGWIASLKLASISMHGRQDWPEFIAEFSGSHRYVIDYLVDEVMARQSEEVQDFFAPHIHPGTVLLASLRERRR